MEGRFLKYEKKGRAGVLSFNNPGALNPLTTETIRELDRFLDGIASEGGIRLLILTGEGKAFVAGADIKEMSGFSPIEAEEFSSFGQKVLRKIEDFPLPVAAAVNGYALGGGLETALACDFIWVSEKAKLGFPETTLGIFPGFSGNRRLVERIGKARAKELIFTGRILSAGEALSIGIVEKIHKPEELIPSLLDLAGEMEKNSPHAIAMVKPLLNRCPYLSRDEADAEEASDFGVLFGHPDQREGMTAFLEKRKAEWRLT